MKQIDQVTGLHLFWSVSSAAGRIQSLFGLNGLHPVPERERERERDKNTKWKGKENELSLNGDIKLMLLMLLAAMRVLVNKPFLYIRMSTTYTTKHFWPSPPPVEPTRVRLAG